MIISITTSVCSITLPVFHVIFQVGTLFALDRKLKEVDGLFQQSSY